MKLNVVPVLNSMLNGSTHYAASHHFNNGQTLAVVMPVVIAFFVMI